MIYAPKFTVYTDNNPLTYVLSSAKLNATGLRRVSELAEFNFEIKYRPGKKNIDADTLSRIPSKMVETLKEHTESINPEMLSTIASTALLENSPITAWVSFMTVSQTPLEDNAQASYTIPTCELISEQRLVE